METTGFGLFPRLNNTWIGSTFTGNLYANSAGAHVRDLDWTAIGPGPAPLLVGIEPPHTCLLDLSFWTHVSWL